VAVPHADLLGERARQRWWILAITLAVLLGAVARAFVLARRFSQPIESLVRESDRISQGDLEPGKAIVTPLAEVHQLADAHDRMRRGLRTLMKLERDLQLARQIQQNTFPRELPRLEGFDLVAWNQPADETGGDSYDVIGLDGTGALTEGEAEAQRAVLLLADATGHGVGPALSVTQLRAMLRMAVRLGKNLLEVATHVNEQLCADLPGNRFITAWLGEVRVAEGTIATFSAGQAPLLLFRAASDTVEVKNADAPPLGLFPELSFAAPPPVALSPGDIYAVLSDGFFEAADQTGAELGKERIIEVIRRHRRETSADILSSILATLRDFTDDDPADDDRTAVIIKRTR
jgi:phosphoserine phosphatase